MTEPRTTFAILARPPGWNAAYRIAVSCALLVTLAALAAAAPAAPAPRDSASTPATTRVDSSAVPREGNPPPSRKLPLDVTIEGVDGELRENVKGVLGIAREKGEVNEAQARTLNGRAPREIANALEPYGYYRSTVTSKFDEQNGKWTVRYVIDPGPAIRIDTVDVVLTGEGANAPAFRRVLGRMPLHKGDVLVHSNYETTKAALVDAALRNGYVDATFTESAIRVDLQRYQAAVVLHYDTSYQHQFGSLVLQQKVLDPKILEGYANFQPGEPFDYRKLTDLEQNLANSTYFSRVEVRPRVDLEEDRRVPIVAELDPARRIRFTAGAGIGSDAGPFGNLGIEMRRLNRRGHRANIQTTIGQIEQSGTAQYQIPWPYPRTDVLTFGLSHGLVKTQTTSERASSISSTLTRAYRTNWTQAYSLAFRRQEFEVGIDRGTPLYLVPSASWSYILRNQPLDPRSGRHLVFSAEGAVKGVVSSQSYVRGVAQGSWLQAFAGWRNRVILRTDLGSLWTDQFHAIPGSVRFFAGGTNSVRGYGYQSLGARDSTGHVTGGSVLLVGSVEYEYRFLRQWGAAVFYDIGNAVRTTSDPLESGAGFGARWVSPVGLVRVDLAFPLSEPGRRMMLHFGIGTGL